MGDAPFAAYQQELYGRAVAGTASDLPFDVAALERLAAERLAAPVYDYVAGGAGAEATMRANRRALERRRLVPRHLRHDVSDRDLTVDLFGRRLAAPVLLAPVGVLGAVRPGGELAVARVAAELGVPWVVPTLSSASLEDVAAEMGDGPRWFQLYWQAEPEVTRSLVARAEAAGYEAIVLTIDTPLPAWRPRDLARAYHPLLGGDGVANYLTDPALTRRAPPDAGEQEIALHAAAMLGDASSTWDDVARLCRSADLPVVVKGVVHPDDAEAATAAGAAGIVVSNHGGRQLDGALGALDALPAVVETVDGAVPVGFDSGIRTGADVIKALALGADMVLLGRPYVWGLAAGGEQGVRQVLRALLAEVDLTLALAGCVDVDALDDSVLATLAEGPR